MFLLKKLVFKLLELSLGLRPCFSLKTRDPSFLNFRLSEAEAEAVRRALPAGYTLAPIRFAAGDAEPSYWLSYNLYTIGYPRPEMASVRKARCEINTFVRDAEGREGVFVFCGSPFVSREETGSAMGRVADRAERLVQAIYGCGALVRLGYEVGDGELRASLDHGGHRVELSLPRSGGGRAGERLSEDYVRFNDVSFFNEGKTFDLVTVDSAFLLARFESLGGEALARSVVKGPFFERAPDAAYLHRGEIGYLVSALHRAGGARA